MGISTFPAASAGGVTARNLKQAVFNSSGTWTYPTSSNFDGSVELTIVAGGGGGGSCLNRSGSGQTVGAGGGGGGQVILRKELSVLNAGNQNVTVGAGGGSYHETGALFGQISSFGSGYIANLYPDPALSKGVISQNTVGVGVNAYPETLNNNNNLGIEQPQLFSSGTNPPQPPVGNTYVNIINYNTNAPVYSQYMSMKPSTSYRIIFSHTFGSTATARLVSPQILWYDTSGINISSSALTTFSNLTAQGSWTPVTSIVTSPANTAYGRIVWISSLNANYRLAGIQVAETAANITSVVYGSSTGYVWTGIPGNSYTVAENATLLAAQGGGGGWGMAWRISNSGQQYYLPGHAGYTAGGLSVSNGASSIGADEIMISGSGGGAGGNAAAQQAPSGTGVSTFILNGSNGHSARHGFVNNNNINSSLWHAGILSSAAYVGSDSSLYNVSSTSVLPMINFGENGAGVEGYGYGGVGSAKSFNPTYNNYFKVSGSGSPATTVGPNSIYSPTTTTHKAAYRGMDNTGNGGPGWHASVGVGDTDFNGPKGGSGVVIVRWYE